MQYVRPRLNDLVVFRQDFQTGIPAGTRGRVIDIFRSRFDRGLVFTIETEEGQEAVVGENDIADEIAVLKHA